MNKKVMLINATDPEEIRVATLVDGGLSDFDIEFVHNEKIKGNIYKAKVVRVDSRACRRPSSTTAARRTASCPSASCPRTWSAPTAGAAGSRTC